MWDRLSTISRPGWSKTDDLDADDEETKTKPITSIV